MVQYQAEIGRRVQQFDGQSLTTTLWAMAALSVSELSWVAARRSRAGQGRDQQHLVAIAASSRLWAGATGRCSFCAAVSALLQAQQRK